MRSCEFSFFPPTPQLKNRFLVGFMCLMSHMPILAGVVCGICTDHVASTLVIHSSLNLGLLATIYTLLLLL